LKEQLASPAIDIANSLLSLLCEQARDEGGSEAEEFCGRIRGYQMRLYESPILDAPTARECIDDCVTYFGRLRTVTQIRTAEFNELIELLKLALTEVTADNHTFHDRLFQTSDNFKRLGNLEDIREIKAQLTRLVRELRQVVIDKQQQEERIAADFSRRVRDLEVKLELARREALTDPLTRIANRAAFDRTAKAWITQKKAFVVVMLDIDYFKSINDGHGHHVGDGALLCAAQWLGEKLRKKDLLARYGGDEFALLIEGISLPQAGRRFSDLIAEFSEKAYTYSDGDQQRTVKFTMSCGVAEFTNGDTLATLTQRADEALYEAKKSRNRACTKPRSVFSGIFEW
jgi:diguanylate cyclase